MVPAREPIGDGTDVAEAELTVAPDLVAPVDWPGCVLTGDARFCQRHRCRQVREAGGAYLAAVQENRPPYHDIAFLFDRREAEMHEHGRGRHDERRQPVAPIALPAYLDWPDVAEVFRLERARRGRDRAERAVRYGITGLPPAVGTPHRLMALKHGRCAIENGSRRTEDVALGEDASRVHQGQGPTTMALLRDAAVSLLRRSGGRQMAARLRAHARHPDPAVAPVLAPLPTGAQALKATVSTRRADRSWRHWWSSPRPRDLRSSNRIAASRIACWPANREGERSIIPSAAEAACRRRCDKHHRRTGWSLLIAMSIRRRTASPRRMRITISS